MTSNLLGCLKRLTICITAPVWLLLMIVAMVMIHLVMLVAGCGQWLWTGKKTILDELDRPSF